MPSEPIIRLSVTDRDALKRYKLQVAGDIGRDFPIGQLIGILVSVAQKHHAEVIELARDRIK